jgi:hypothetical protein
MWLKGEGHKRGPEKRRFEDPMRSVIRNECRRNPRVLPWKNPDNRIIYSMNEHTVDKLKAVFMPDEKENGK